MALGCFGPCAYYFLTTFGAFSVIGMACYTLSQLLAPLGLPLVTICIAFGVSCGPYGFDLIHEVSSAARPDAAQRVAWVFVAAECV